MIRTLGRVTAGVGLVLAFFAGAFAFSLPTAWVLMLLLGAIHSAVDWVPAVGFWISLLIMMACTILFKSTPGSK